MNVFKNVVMIDVKNVVIAYLKRCLIELLRAF